MDSEAISTFCSITGASTDVAQSFMQLSGNDVSRAIELFFENPDLASSVQTAGNPAREPQTTSTSRTGRQDPSGVIHIDSDDDDSMNIDDGDSDGEDGRAAAAYAANLAQEEEDAAMAKRLQEEMYQGQSSGAGGPVDEDGVRAPIARTTETLVAPDPAWGPLDDGEMEMNFLNQMRRRRMAQGRPGNPFSQRIWGDSGNESPDTPDETDDSSNNHARRLADLFRPPYDIMERNLAWDDVRAIGKADKKWIMVNLQDMNDFSCQALNRDIWKDENVKQLVKDHFVFLQYDKDYPDAEEYTTFYFPHQGHENIDNYPHVSIIDPRTGEQVKVWSGRPFPQAAEFHAELAEFLDRYSLEANSKNPVAPVNSKKPKAVDVNRMTEEEMLEMALRNSMAATAGSSGSGSTSSIHDPDSLTRQQAEDEGKGKGKEAEAPANQSEFSRISSTRPHVEPENEAGTTTRIQFRHPTGRVIRRFRLDDTVRRAYEWLKAEPLEGREGVEFELKKMPQGQDLIDCLDTTVEESGLKQGTVMIEFIED